MDFFIWKSRQIVPYVADVDLTWPSNEIDLFISKLINYYSMEAHVSNLIDWTDIY